MVSPTGTIWTAHLSSGRALSAPSCSALPYPLLSFCYRTPDRPARTWLAELMLSDTAFWWVKTLYPCVHQTTQFHAKKVNEKNSQDALTEHLSSTAKMGTEFLFTIWSSLRNKAWISSVIRTADKNFLNLNLLLLLYISLYTIIITYLLESISIVVALQSPPQLYQFNFQLLISWKDCGICSAES